VYVERGKKEKTSEHTVKKILCTSPKIFVEAKGSEREGKKLQEKEKGSVRLYVSDQSYVVVRDEEDLRGREREREWDKEMEMKGAHVNLADLLREKDE